ncbi:DnaB-like helicase C-terminal domain-containing protein [Rhodoferax sp. GW822-FHT02A01]|uniref:DnaB-like helicase C-terminal domain-containing protein n=1 Tax=Rhodoferax sp. GW822-FHT02A01 TaxID=3141537 RepID=UPI00315DD151
MELIPDDIDFEAYLEETEFKAKVQSAAHFAEDVKAELDPRAPESKHPGLLMRKAKGLIHFRPSEVSVWHGFNGHRKSMFTSQVALDLAAQGERVLIASLEMLPHKTMARMTRQGTGLHDPVPELIDRFHEWTDGKLWLFNHVGRISPEKALGLCRYFKDELQGTHIFLDSWMMICNSEERLDEQKQFSTDICRMAQETGLHVHVVAHDRKPSTADGENKVPTRYDIRGSGSISDQASNIFAVWMNKSKFARLDANPNDSEAREQPCAILKCDKQRSGAWEGSLKLWHDPSSLRFCEDRTSPVLPYKFITNSTEEVTQ